MTGTITVPAACTFSINPTSVSLGPTGTMGVVTVTAGAGCAWTAVSNNVVMLAVVSGASGTGNGTVTYSVFPNPGPARTGTLTIAGQTFTVTQAGASCAPITVSPPTLPTATVGVPMSVTLTASGGTAPYSWAVTQGSLPPGITLSTGGVLSGTPTLAGNFGFTIDAIDATACVGARDYSLTVLAPVPALPPMWMALLVVATIALVSWSVTRRALQRR
jgi:hypothetical protein